MQVIPGIAALRQRLAPERTSSFVPTMGNLHAGHLDLVRIAREHGSPVVVSVFVNPLQFGPQEDFGSYPRTLQQDLEQLEALSVDVVFTPDQNELYPVAQQVLVEPPPVGDTLEGEFRPGFFRGVATVVLKLFNIVRPRYAVFGKKDYQQLFVVREMVRQLNLPIQVVAGETVRAADGLALSSRNAYLSPGERAEAPRLYGALVHIKHELESGNRDLRGLENETKKMLDSRGWKVDYVALQQRSTLAQAGPEDRELVALAAGKLGSTRLIDNIEVTLDR